MTDPTSRAKTWWLLQALSGLALVLLLGVHFVAQHYVAQGGLRTYAQVVAYVRHPAVAALEAIFLVVVAVHAALGLRAVALDFGLPAARQRGLNAALAVGVVLVVGYGLWLLAQVRGGAG